MTVISKLLVQHRHIDLIKGETMANKKKQVKSQFSSLLKIHKDRYKYAEEAGDKNVMFSASIEIARIEELMADELSRKSKKLIEEELAKNKAEK
jgi:hypothetical protein